MNKTYILMFSFLVSLQAKAQTFNLLANDPLGDVTVSFIPDIQSLHYSMDMMQDSIWFKVQTYTAVDPNGDVGLMFGLDTNLVLTDGIAWNGNNTSMKYDHAFLVFQDVISPNYYGFIYHASGSFQIPTQVLRPDSFTFIIRTQLSLLDSDGNFHLLFGSGAFDILSTRSVYDDVPNTGFLTVNGVTGVPEISQHQFSVYPNPVGCVLNIFYENSFMSDDVLLRLFSADGKVVILQQLFQGQHAIDLSSLPPGIYMCDLSDNNKNIWSRQRIVKL